MAKYIIPFSFLLFLSFSSCDEGQQILNSNIDEIEDFIAENNLDAQRTENDLFYVVLEEGNGEFPDITDEVTVDYHGYFTNGIVFDSSVDRGEPVTFPLTNVIRGWQQGIPLFSKGGSGILLIPSHLAYGEQGVPGSIPSNSVIVFDVNLLDF